MLTAGVSLAILQKDLEKELSIVQSSITTEIRRVITFNAVIVKNIRPFHHLAPNLTQCRSIALAYDKPGVNRGRIRH